MANSYPELFVGVNFPHDSFDPNAPNSWADLTAIATAAPNLQRGRQYELDQTQAGQGTVTWFNVNEYLNPVNTTSPYAPNVVPYRPFTLMGMWPVGGTGNLINSLYNSTDPTFEAYSAGAALAWVTGVGGAVPLVVTSTS